MYNVYSSYSPTTTSFQLSLVSPPPSRPASFPVVISDPLGPLSAAHGCEAIQRVLIKPPSATSLSVPQQPSPARRSSSRVGPPRPPLSMLGFDWRALVQVRRELTGSTAMPHPEDNIPQISFPFASPYVLYPHQFAKFPEPWVVEVNTAEHPGVSALVAVAAQWCCWAKLGAAHFPWFCSLCCRPPLSLLKLRSQLCFEPSFLLTCI